MFFQECQLDECFFITRRRCNYWSRGRLGLAPGTLLSLPIRERMPPGQRRGAVATGARAAHPAKSGIRRQPPPVGCEEPSPPNNLSVLHFGAHTSPSQKMPDKRNEDVRTSTFSPCSRGGCTTSRRGAVATGDGAMPTPHRSGGWLRKT